MEIKIFFYSNKEPFYYQIAVLRFVVPRCGCIDEKQNESKRKWLFLKLFPDSIYNKKFI